MRYLFPNIHRWWIKLIWLGTVSMLLANCNPALSAVSPAQSATNAEPSPTTPDHTAYTTKPTGPTLAMPTPQPNLLHEPSNARGYLTTPNELRHTAALAQDGIEPYTQAVQAELDYAQSALEKKDLAVPRQLSFDDDIDKPAYLSTGSKYVYAWAIAYNLLRDHDLQQANTYAQRAHALLMGMPEQGTQVRNYDNNTRLNISVYIQNFVYAADLLADWVPPGQDQPFANSPDAQKFKQWLGAEIIRYPYNAAHTRVNNWGAWGRLSTAVIADYVGDAAPLYVQGMQLNTQNAYDIAPDFPCDARTTNTCTQVAASTMYANALQLHIAVVDGQLNEFSLSSCDSSGSKSMIRPDGGIPDELRRQYDCDATQIADPYGPAARYSQFAIEAMTSLAELAWRRGDTSIYTHIDAATDRGALWRAVQFLINNHVTITRSSMLEMINHFYTYQANVENNEQRRAEYQTLLAADLPGTLKRQGDWPADAAFVSFGTLTHGFAADEVPQPPPTSSPR